MAIGNMFRQKEEENKVAEIMNNPAQPMMTQPLVQPTKFSQISPWGSADSKNIESVKTFLNAPPELAKEFESKAMNPLFENFAKDMLNSDVRKKLAANPKLQVKMADMDNIIKNQSGIFRENSQGLQEYTKDLDGSSLYAMPESVDYKKFNTGYDRLNLVGTMLQSFGALEKDEATKLAKYTKVSGDPAFMGNLSGLAASGKKKEAVNTLLSTFDAPTLDKLDLNNQKDASLAYAAYNYVNGLDKMSPGQQSLGLSAFGMTSFTYKDGKPLGQKNLVREDLPPLSVGDAMAFAGTGTDVNTMIKNYDQIDVIQRITFGKGTSSQLAATANRLGFTTNPQLGNGSVMQKPEQLGSLGFRSVPSIGIGAITGPENNLPKDYEVVGAGGKQGQVIAVPKGLSFSAATINGSAQAVSLNPADGLTPASPAAFKMKENWLGANKIKGKPKGIMGSKMSAGLQTSGLLNDPYTRSAITTASVMGNTVGRSNFSVSDTAKESLKKGATAGIKAGAKGAVIGGTGVLGGALATGGVVAVGVAAGANFVADGGMDVLKGDTNTQNVTDAALNLNPFTGWINPLGKVLGFESVGNMIGGGKSEEQRARDSMRELAKKNGLAGDDWKVTLADGSRADIGSDGKSGRHEFRFADKAVGEVRSLNAYDVDYTNDLDFSSNMMTSALTRMMAGGKGVPIDQFAGQLGNAALGSVGFGQDMTEENFNKVRDNVRGFYVQQGIKTKEDAYALANQMYAEGRISEIDQVAMHQGINMVFDEDGYSDAMALMAGRWKGLETAADIGQAPGPIFKPAFPSDLNKPFRPIVSGMSQGRESSNASSLGTLIGGIGAAVKIGDLLFGSPRDPDLDPWGTGNLDTPDFDFEFQEGPYISNIDSTIYNDAMNEGFGFNYDNYVDTEDFIKTSVLENI